MPLQREPCTKATSGRRHGTGGVGRAQGVLPWSRSSPSVLISSSWRTRAANQAVSCGSTKWTLTRSRIFMSLSISQFFLRGKAVIRYEPDMACESPTAEKAAQTLPRQVADITGQRFDRLVAIAFVEIRGAAQTAYWRFR